MKIIVIKNQSDIDIILENGSYAFSWVADGVRKIECYQDKITEKLENEDSLNEMLEKSKCYFLEEMDFDTDIFYIVEKVIDWMIPGIYNNEFETIELKNQNLEDLINEFLKLK